MSERIKVGDSVVVVLPPICCPTYKHLGTVFKVTKIAPGHCNLCGHKAVMAGDGDVSGYSLHELKRIPPLSELEELKERVEA